MDNGNSVALSLLKIRQKNTCRFTSYKNYDFMIGHFWTYKNPIITENLPSISIYIMFLALSPTFIFKHGINFLSLSLQ